VEVGMNSREKSTHISADISRSYYEKFLGIVDKFYCWLASLVGESE
jgi:hypothetical protein